MKDESGQVLIEFVFAVIIFVAFLYGLLAVSWWGIGASFVQEAAHATAQRYATTIDPDAAEQECRKILGKWAYLFIKPGSVSVDVWKDGDTARVEVSAEPKFTKLYLYSLPKIVKTSSCTFEYRFRHPEEFNW